ncbi:target of Nesh-SH3 isoform X30 [Mauremys reevesii]|uniref:target of Nesh-SH3 isoform X30 n=1 Tax=Mauremys reevesii TaxID=260615 RepID=UPI00193FBCF6|nr:target of Nesh-SH3 isoform X30 [Mauremys reevesii]
MISRLVFLLFCGHIALNLGNAQKLPRVKRQNLKVQINATDDTICMKYLRLSPDTKLQGFILGYGSSSFSNQYIPLPSEGKSYVTEVDAEPRYLITVRTAPVPNHKKTCSGKTKTQKPLQLVIGTLTPTSVYLSWGILVNPQHDWTAMSSCTSDRFYTVRYREKDKSKNWGFQLCPTTETIVENLKPNTPYEFGVKDNTEDGIWSKIFNHKTILFNKNKENGQLQNTYKVIPNIQTQLILKDGPKLVPVTIIKQVIQNVTRRMLPKTTDRPSVAGAILVHLIIPGLNETPQQKLPKPETLGIAETPKKILVTNETQTWPAESKTPKVQEISPRAFPATIESVQESIKPTMSASSEKSEASPAHSKNELESAEPSIAPTTKLPLKTLAHSETDSGLEETKSIPKPDPAKTQNILASNEMQLIPSGSKISDMPKILQTKPATKKPALKSTSFPSMETPGTVTAFDETQFVSSRSKPSGIPEKLPTKSATKKPALKSTSFPSMETPGTVTAFDETQFVSSRSKPSGIPEKLPTKSVTIQTTLKPVTPEASKAEVASYDFLHVSSTPQTSEISEISVLESVTNSADLETSVPLISRIPHLLGTTMAFDDTHPVFSNPTTSNEPDRTDLKPAATSEPTLESFSPKTSSPLEWPRKTLAPNEAPLIPSKLKPSPLPEVQHVKPAQKPPLLEHSTPKASKTIERPKATLAPWETKFVPSTPKPSARPKMQRTKPAEKAIHLESNTPKFSNPLELPRTTLAPSKTKRIPSKPKVSLHPEEPKTKPAATREPVPVPVTIKISSITATTKTLEHPKSTMVSYEPQHIPSKPKASASAMPEMPHSKPESSEIHFTPLKPKSSSEPKMPQSKPAPTETQFIPSKPNTSPEPELPHPKPVLEHITLRIEPARSTIAPKETRRVPLKPKTSLKPHVPQTKPAPEAAIFRTEQPKTPLAPKEARRVPSKPKSSPSPDVPQTKPAPKETRRVPSKPKTSPIPDVPPTKPAPHKVRLTSARPKIFDKPQTRPALNKTTPGPGRTKTAGVMRWGGTPTETVQNFTNFLMGSNISLESNITRKKPDSVATAPGRRHPPLAPAKPTQVRRKPLPPNTVTGKPGSAGIALKSRAPPSPTTIVAKSTGPTISLKMETPRKKPTVSASPEDYVNTTVFSSNPTSETDSLGKQRFTGPHVKYIPKNDSEPCSITRTLKYFQEKKVREQENVTSPPQNPPSNLTVVTVEGCPSFVILNWTKPENDTVTYYVVLSTVNGTSNGTEKITVTTKQTHCIVENLEPNRSYDFQVKASNPFGEGPSTSKVLFSTESADPRVSEPISMGKDAIWTEVPFNSDSYSECKGKQYVKRTWYKKFVGVQLCNSLRYKIYLSDSLTGQFYNIGDERGHGEDHCQFVDSFLDGRTGQRVFPDQLPTKDGFFRAVRQEPVKFGKIGGETHITYVHWYECGTSIPGKW